MRLGGKLGEGSEWGGFGAMMEESMNALASALESAAAVELPIVWVLGIVGSLATVVTVLAKLIYSMMNRQIDALTKQIERLQGRVDKLQKGCGVQGCAWRLPGG